MIERVFYNNKMRELTTLIGLKLTKEQIDLIYQKISHSYENDDLGRAIEDLIPEGRFNYSTLIQNLDYYASLRREKEAKIEKAKEIEEFKRFWSENKEAQKACNRKCLSCKVIFCDIIKQASIKAIKAIQRGEKTAEEAEKEMSEQFEGWRENFMDIFKKGVNNVSKTK